MNTIKDVFTNQLALFYMVRVAVDPVVPGLQVPNFLIKDGTIFHLDFGLDLPRPINDLKITDLGITGTLSFGGVPNTCYLPWAAVIGFVPLDSTGRGRGRNPWTMNLRTMRAEEFGMIPDPAQPVPPDAGALGTEEPTPALPKVPPRNGLRVITDEETPDPMAVNDVPPSVGERPRLRIV